MSKNHATERVWWGGFVRVAVTIWAWRVVGFTSVSMLVLDSSIAGAGGGETRAGVYRVSKTYRSGAYISIACIGDGTPRAEGANASFVLHKSAQLQALCHETQTPQPSFFINTVLQDMLLPKTYCT
eukprot:1237875-Amphidinium_carterae.1